MIADVLNICLSIWVVLVTFLMAKYLISYCRLLKEIKDERKENKEEK